MNEAQIPRSTIGPLNGGNTKGSETLRKTGSTLRMESN